MALFLFSFRGGCAVTSSVLMLPLLVLMFDSVHAELQLKLASQGAQRRLEDCQECNDEPTGYMTSVGLTCANATYHIDTKCNEDQYWITQGFCRQSCFEAGRGYDNDNCCPSTTDPITLPPTSAPTDFPFSSTTCSWDNPPDPYYVNFENGTDSTGNGLSEESPFATIAYAVTNRLPCQTIYVLEGLFEYSGTNKIVNLNNVWDLKILGHPNNVAKPILSFAFCRGAFLGSNVTNVEIAGLEIVGPNDDMTYEEAMAARNETSNTDYGYNSRGIAIWSGHHIYIHDNVVHHCPASGIRVDNGDYITIDSNHVHSNTWWTSVAESAIVLATSVSIDQVTSTKMFLTNNLVHDNVNKIPYLNRGYAWDYSPLTGGCGNYTPCELGLVEGCPWQCRYGKLTQDYIIDGMGVYVTRNQDTYVYGRMELSYNTCYRNGINGIGYHLTDRGVVRGNFVFDNGVVPVFEENPIDLEDWQINLSKSRQRYSGIVLNQADDVELWDNRVVATYDDDFAFRAHESPAVVAGAFNMACRGREDILPSGTVETTDDESLCLLDIPSSSQPTMPPSIPPTPTPSSVPSVTLSATPSVSPSVPPTENPSLLPSPLPSLFPTTDSPTATPSVSPSDMPTIPPTENPSLLPSPLPSLSLWQIDARLHH